MINKLKEIGKQLFYYPKLELTESNYDEYWKNKRGSQMGYSNTWQKQRGDWIVSKVEEGSTLLDIGCGDGGVLLYMKSKKSFNAIGADISSICLEFLESKNVSVIRFDINNYENIKDLPQVDYIMILEVLEHMPNPEKFLNLIKEKANKAVFLSFPNSGYFTYRLRLLFGSFPLQWTLHPGEHLRFWTYRDLKWWLRELKLNSVSTIQVYEGIPILNKIWKSLFGAGFIVEVKK